MPRSGGGRRGQGSLEATSEARLPLTPPAGRRNRLFCGQSDLGASVGCPAWLAFRGKRNQRPALESPCNVCCGVKALAATALYCWTKENPSLIEIPTGMSANSGGDQPDRSAAERLAGFHQTISEQLNARLAESPRFFWVLVAVSAAYGYVLWHGPRYMTDPWRREGLRTFILASLLPY